MIQTKWIVAAVLGLLIALLLNLNLLAYAIFAIVGLIVISKWLTKRWATEVTATRSCQQLTANVGDSVIVEMKVENHGRMPVPWALIEDLLPKGAINKISPSMEVKGDRIAVARLPAGDAHHMLYQIKCKRRGYFQLGPLVLETGDMFGLNRRFRVLSEPNFLMVYPKTIPLAAYDISSKRPIGEVVMTSRLFEDPTRIAGVRRYQQGDPMRRIHWRATARSGQLQSKVYEPSSLAGATILIDFHLNAYEPSDEPVRSELAITCAASISKALHDMNQQVGIISNGRDAVDRIQQEGWRGDARTRNEARQSATMKTTSDRLEPVLVQTGKAPDQFMRILRSLARLEKTDGLLFPDFVVQAMVRLPRDATVVVIISRVTVEKAVALGSLKRQGFAVTAIVNCHSEEHFIKASGILLGHGIESRHLKNENSIVQICERQLVRF
jgi:uncharacterized protein (DUF58 family)